MEVVFSLKATLQINKLGCSNIGCLDWFTFFLRSHFAKHVRDVSEQGFRPNLLPSEDVHWHRWDNPTLETSSPDGVAQRTPSGVIKHMEILEGKSHK